MTLHALHLPRVCSRAAVLALAAIVLPFAAAACSDSSGTDAAADGTTSTTVEPGSASIDSFVVPASVACNGLTSAKVTVEYAITGSASQQLIVDGRPVPGMTAPSGSVEAEVHCDDLPHTFVLYALDDAGRPTTQQILLKTTL